MKNFLLIALLTYCFTFSLPAQNSLTPELLWDLGRVSGGSVSPDGNWLLYGVTAYDVSENKGNRNLYLIPVEGGDPIQITNLPGYEYNEQWRPDGEKIGFLSGHEGSAQLYEINLDGEELQKVTNVSGGIDNVAYSPTMAHIYFTREVKMQPTLQEMYPDLPKANARIIDDLMYRHWDKWEDVYNNHIFITEYNNGTISNEMKDIMPERMGDTPIKPFGGPEEISWSSDGQIIAYTFKNTQGLEYAQSTNSDIYFYYIETGQTENITEGMEGYDKRPVFSLDNRYMAWSSMKRAGFESDRNRIFILDLETGHKQEITEEFERDANSPAWASDGQKMYFTSGVNATYQIYEINIQSGETRQITNGPHNFGGVKFARNELIASKMSMSASPELYSINPESGEERQLTFTNREIYDNLQLGDVEERWIKTTDNKEMLVWVIYPPDFDPNKKYPTLLYCQGGPQSAVSQFFSFRWNFQLMAAQGYIVVAPNRRGLPSFGREWNDQISGDWGGQAMEDYLSAIDAVAEEPYVDNDRIGAVGASFGGYSVYWLAGNHEGRFSALISHCGLFNLTSWYGTTEELFFANWDLGGPYWEEELQEEYEKFSPHTYAENWDTPILVIHGEKDYRVPISEGMQAFQVAQIKGIPSRFLYFPEEGHWVLSPQNGVLWHRVFFDWLDMYLKE